jgi:transcriptional regulator with XRE-family HTH domain
MSEITSLVSTTKKLLKNQGLTYRDVSKAMKLSEPSVKRMFATKRFTLHRLSQVCELLGFTLAELTQEAESDRQRIKTLTAEQEALLVSDVRLLLTAVCALNHWKISDIVAAYQLTEAECLQRLLILDRLQVIELLPDNRIRLVIARDFDWLPNGAIREFFRTHGLDDFLKSSFSEPEESTSFMHGMFTDAAYKKLRPELLHLKQRFSELHEESLTAPLSQRIGSSLLIASKQGWEPVVFAHLRR